VAIGDTYTIVGTPVVYACRLNGSDRGGTLLNQQVVSTIRALFEQSEEQQDATPATTHRVKDDYRAAAFRGIHLERVVKEIKNEGLAQVYDARTLTYEMMLQAQMAGIMPPMNPQWRDRRWDEPFALLQAQGGAEPES
jgi:hypothetical protein